MTEPIGFSHLFATDSSTMERTSAGTFRHGGSGARGAFARYYGVFGRPQTYLNLVYLLLGLPLGAAYFTFLVTAISTAGGLAVTIVGLPLLVATMYGWCVLGAFDRLQTNLLLGAGIPPLNFAGEEGPYWRWPRIKARLKNGLTWRSLAFLFLRFPHGLATFILATVLVSIPFWMVAMPISAHYGDGADFGIWHADTAAKGLVFVVPGILLAPLPFHLMNVVAAFSGRFARVFLDSPAAGEPTRAAFDRGVIAAATWPGLSIGRPLPASRARAQTLQMRLFAAHTALFGGVSLLLLTINGLTTPDTWWSAWPIWGLAIPFAAHAGYLLRGVLGLHAALYAVINLGLFIIDAAFTDTSWFFYPLFGWGVLLVAHLLSTRGSNPISRRLDANLNAGQPASAILPERHPHSSPEAVEARPVPISIDVVMRRVEVDGRLIDLTPKEFDLLALFAQNPGRPFSRDELLDRVWRNDYEVTDRTIDTHVQRLRKKLGAQADAIQTVWGVGYKFQSAE